jgi:hypothetical protein
MNSLTESNIRITESGCLIKSSSSVIIDVAIYYIFRSTVFNAAFNLVDLNPKLMI